MAAAAFRRSLVIACFAAGRVAHAQTDERVRLSWVRAGNAAECPGAGHIEKDVARRLGRSPFAAEASRSVEILVSRNGGVWKSEIELRSSSGESLGSRTVTSEAPSCDSLARASALATALLIDPNAGITPADAEPPPPEPPPAAPAGTPAGTPAADPGSALPAESAPRSGPSGFFGLAAVAAVRVLPGAAGGAALTGEIALSDVLLLAVSGQHLFEQPASRAASEVEFGLTFLGAGPCYRAELAQALSLCGCVSVLAGVFRAVVHEPAPADVGERFWWAAAAGLRVGVVPAEPFELRAGVDVLMPVNRRNNVVEQPATGVAVEAFEEPAVGAQGSLGLGVRFE